MEKGVPGRWAVFAFQGEGGANPGEPVTGDAANISADIYIDGVHNVVDDTNPTEHQEGYYCFDLTAAETNGDHLLIVPMSVTSNVIVIGAPAAQWTDPPNHNKMAISDPSGAVDVRTVEAGGIAAASIADGAIRNDLLTDDTKFAGAFLDVAISSRLAPLQAGRALSITNTNLANANVAQWRETQPNTLDGTNVRASVADTTAGGVTALQNAINGGAWTLATESDGSISASMDKILKTTLTQTTAGRLAGNFGFFYENADAQTTKVVDDVGGGGGGSSPWTEADVEGMRYRCQLDGKQTQPTTDAPQQFTVTATGLSAVATQVDDLWTWNRETPIPGKIAAPTTLTGPDAARWAYKLLIARREQDETEERVYDPTTDALQHRRDKAVIAGPGVNIGKLEVAP